VTRLALLAAGVAVLFAAVAGCGSSTKKPAPQKATATVSSAAGSSSSAGGITISGFAYSGQLTVKPGEKVTLINKDAVAHTLTDKKSHRFDSGDIPAGGMVTLTAPSQPGGYTFGCTYHPQMHGTLIVRP
jgi:plastocyanin